MKITFAEKLKKLRIDSHLTQTGLAMEFNVSLKTISHWETGYSEPSIKQLITIANFFDVTLDELVGRE